MATFNSLQDDLVLCPYSHHHKVKRGRLNIHISKCRRDARRRRVKPCPFNPDHDAPAEPEDYRQHLATCPDRTSKLLCTATKDDPPYEVPAPGGARPFLHEPEEEWVAEPGRTIDPFKPAVPPIFRTVTGLKPAERRRYYQSLSANGPPVVYVPQAPKLEPKEVRPTVFRPIKIGQPHSQQATQAQTSSLGTNQAVQLKASQPGCSAQAEASRPCGVQETLAQKSLWVAPQAHHVKASQPSSALALGTQQFNQASQSCTRQATQDQSGHPRNTNAEAGKPFASQATQLLTGHPKKPLLAVQTEAVTGEYRGTWDQARVGQPYGAEVTHPTGNLGAARASAKRQAVESSTTQDQSALPAPGAIDVDALARRLMGLGSTRQHQS